MLHRARGLSRQIAIVVILIRKVRIRRELIAGVAHRPACRPVPHRSIGKGLGVQQQGMAGAGESIHLIIAERLLPLRSVKLVRLPTGL